MNGRRVNPELAGVFPKNRATRYLLDQDCARHVNSLQETEEDDFDRELYEYCLGLIPSANRAFASGEMPYGEIMEWTRRLMLGLSQPTDDESKEALKQEHAKTEAILGLLQQRGVVVGIFDTANLRLFELGAPAYPEIVTMAEEESGAITLHISQTPTLPSAEECEVIVQDLASVAVGEEAIIMRYKQEMSDITDRVQLFNGKETEKVSHVLLEAVLKCVRWARAIGASPYGNNDMEIQELIAVADDLAIGSQGILVRYIDYVTERLRDEGTYRRDFPKERNLRDYLDTVIELQHLKPTVVGEVVDRLVKAAVQVGSTGHLSERIDVIALTLFVTEDVPDGEDVYGQHARLTQKRAEAAQMVNEEHKSLIKNSVQ